MKGYIYKITNKKNGKAYIGKTYRTIEQRWKEHVRDSQKRIFGKRPLYRAMSKYGTDNFTIEMLGKYKEEVLEEKEIMFIKKYNTYKDGYNATTGGDGKPRTDKDMVLKLFHSNLTQKEIAKKTGYDKATIKKIVEGQGYSFLSRGERGREITSKPVIQLHKRTGEVLAEFSSISEAEKYHGAKPGKGHIGETCRGERKTALGFKWRFK